MIEFHNVIFIRGVKTSGLVNNAIFWSKKCGGPLVKIQRYCIYDVFSG